MKNLLFLHGWAFHTSVRTKHTTIALSGLEHRFTLLAGVEKLARIGGHSFFFLMTTFWAFDDRLKNHCFSVPPFQ
jgi:hypothetical protein